MQTDVAGFADKELYGSIKGSVNDVSESKIVIDDFVDLSLKKHEFSGNSFRPSRDNTWCFSERQLSGDKAIHGCPHLPSRKTMVMMNA